MILSVCLYEYRNKIEIQFSLECNKTVQHMNIILYSIEWDIKCSRVKCSNIV